jgi:hypothetical protein
MGPGDFEDVLKKWEARALAGDKAAAAVWAKVKSVESRGRKKVHRNVMNAGGTINASALLGVLRGWLFAYNTVEEILLFSAGTVALMGIMYASLTPASANYQASKDSVTWVIVGAIILTIVYFFTVLITETYMMYTESTRKVLQEKLARNARKSSGGLGKKGAAGESEEQARNREAANARGMGEVNIGTVDASFNPMFDGASQSTAGLREVVATTPGLPAPDLWRIFRTGFQQMEDDMKRLTKESNDIKVRQQKLEAASALLERATGKHIDVPQVTAEDGSKFKVGRKKAAFGPTTAGGEGDEGAVAGVSPLGALGRRMPSFGGGSSPALGASKSLRNLSKK